MPRRSAASGASSVNVLGLSRWLFANRRAQVNPVPFAFNRGVVGGVFPPSPANRVYARMKPLSEGVVEAVFAPATYAFVISSLDLAGSCTLRPGDDFSIKDFSIGPVDEADSGSTPVDGSLLTKEFSTAFLRP